MNLIERAWEKKRQPAPAPSAPDSWVWGACIAGAIFLAVFKL